MAIYDRIAGLPVRIEGYELEVRSLELAPEFVRMTTVIHLHGGGEEGVGEDVSYMPEDHERQAEAGATLPLTGGWSIDELSQPPRRPGPLVRRGADDGAVPRLPPVGVRERRARPRAAPGGGVARRRPGAAARAAHLRRLHPARRPRGRRRAW